MSWGGNERGFYALCVLLAAIAAIPFIFFLLPDPPADEVENRPTPLGGPAPHHAPGPPRPEDGPLDAGVCDGSAVRPWPELGAFPEPPILWLSADLGVETGDDARVQAWRDRSGHGNDFGKGTLHDAPRFLEHAHGCEPAVQFDGQAALSRTDALGLIATEGRTFVVVARAANRARAQHLFGQSRAADLVVHLGITLNPFGSDGERFGVYFPGHPFQAMHIDRGLKIHTFSMRAVEATESFSLDREASTFLRYRIDGVAQSLARTGRGMPTTGAALSGLSVTSVGCFPVSFHRCFEGEVFAVVVLRGAPTDAVLGQTERLLADRYGVALP